jgi:hypothetical protein
MVAPNKLDEIQQVFSAASPYKQDMYHQGLTTGIAPTSHDLSI